MIGKDTMFNERLTIPLHRNLDVVSVHLNGISRNLDRRSSHLLTRANVVFPHVPGTGDHVAFENAFTQRPAAMKASVVERTDGATHIEKGDRFAVGVNRLALAFR